MSNRIPYELSLGDIVRPSKSSHQYVVTRFTEGEGPYVDVELTPTAGSGGPLIRRASTVIKNWRLVKATA